LDQQTGSEPQPSPSQERPPGQQPSSSPPEQEPGRGGWTGSWVAGLVVIVVGVVFLGRNAGWFGDGWGFDNWWALFILIPAFGTLTQAWRSYSAGGRLLNGDAARALTIGLVLVAVTVIFLLELDWGKVWPVLLVIVGVGLLLGWRRH
jgi:hypothetical protein